MAPSLPSMAAPGDERSVRTVSLAALGLVLFQLSATSLAALLDVRRAKSGSAKAEGRTAWWVQALCLSSYALLVPGLVMHLFFFNITAMDGHMPLHHATKSTLTFVHTLASSGGWLGCAFVVLFAMIIPLAKILMFLLAELWRCSSNPSRVAHARTCVVVLQAVSKWACPDMFAYILMVYLIRNLTVPPLLEGTMQLDIGFTCFTLFCVGSTIASLGVSVPPPVSKDEPDDASETKSVETEPKIPLAVKCLGTKGMVCLAAALLVAWLSLFLVGVLLPCMALRLNVEALVESGKIQQDMADIAINVLKLPEKAKADVSIWKCMVALFGWSNNGDANDIIAFVMLAVFVLLSTCADWLLLSRVVMMFEPSRGEYKTRKWLDPARSMTFSRYLKKICMLDVLIMGVIVVILSASMYKAQGLVLSPRWGLASLFAGEVCHYAVHSLLAATMLCTQGSAAGASNERGAAEADGIAPEAATAGSQTEVA